VFKVVKRAGAWFSFVQDNGQEHRWQGRDSMVEAIRSNLELQAEITKVTLETATQ